MSLYRRDFVKLGLAAAAMPAFLRQASAAGFAPQPSDWRGYALTTWVQLPQGGPAQIWLPVPEAQGDYQRVLGSTISGNATEAEIVTDPTSGAQMLYARFDAGAAPVERLREEGRWVLCIGFERDGRCDAAGSGERPVGLGVIALVGERGARRDIRPQIQQQLEQRAVAGLAAGQVEGERMAIKVALEVDLGGEATARAAETLARSPPVAPAA